MDKVAIRVDFNVPLVNGAILDSSRIDAVLPEIKYWLARSSQLTIITHLGRPHGVDEDLSLAPIAAHLGKILGQEIPLVRGWPLHDSHEHARIRMAENIRFFPQEEACDQAFCQALAQRIDQYVFDAFSVAHRRHATTYGIFKQMQRVHFGQQFEREIRKIHEIYQPTSRRVVVLGGAKTTSKIGLLSGLMEQVDAVLLGGLMGQTFLRARDGVGEGYEAPCLDEARAILKVAEQKGVKVHLPTDGLNADGQVIAAPFQEASYDVGPDSLQEWLHICQGATQIIWNGPLGVFEDSKYPATRAFAKALQDVQADVMLGGGETLAVIDKEDWLRYHYISTGGGAFLYFLEHRSFPCQKIEH